MQPSKFDIAFIRAARVISELSHDPHTKVGCVLVKDRYIIAQGYNGTPSGYDSSTKDRFGKTLPTVIHAEMNAILHAARTTQSLVGAVAYTTLHPCIKCSIHMYQAGISEIIYCDKKEYDEPISKLKYRRVDDGTNTEFKKLSE